MCFLILLLKLKDKNMSVLFEGLSREKNVLMRTLEYSSLTS